MYIRIADTTIFPYDLSQLKFDCPNVSFPAQFTEEILNEYGVFRVQYEEAPAADERTQRVQYEETPTYVNDSWVIRCNVVDKDQASIDTYDAYISSTVKIKRDKLLAESDWITIKAIERNEAIPDAWKTYRQALRDITLQTGFPHNVVWPTQPGVN
jgi:hypothetical protein